MPVARLTKTGSTIRCETPYDPKFVDGLKVSIPAAYREWKPDHKVWIIRATYQRELIKLCRRYYDDVEIVEEPSDGAVIPERYRTLYVLPGAPLQVVDAAYKALTRIHHPDVSDDPHATTHMQQINAAYEEVTEEVGS